MIGLFDRLSRPLLRALDPEDAHALAIKALRFMPWPGAGRCRRACGARLRAQFPRSGRSCSRFRQECAGAGCPAARSGSASSRSAPSRRARKVGQPAAASVSPRVGRGRSSTGSASTTTARRWRMCGSPGARNAGGIVGVNIGANRDSTDRTADYVAADRDLCRRRQLFHRQCVVAQHAGPARPAAGIGARRFARRASSRRASGCAPRAGLDAGAAQDRARPDAARSRRCGRRLRASAASTA